MEKRKKKTVLFFVLTGVVLCLVAIVLIFLLATNYNQISSLVIKSTPTFTQTATVTFTSVPPTITQTPVPTNTNTPTPTKTKTITPSPTLFADTRMGAVVQSLYDDGVLHSTEGTYYLMDDFDESWAQINWYQWYPTYFSPENFVIRVDASWESASQTADWWNSGCGFVFSATDDDNYHAVFVTMDGYVVPHKYKGGYYYPLQYDYYARFEIPKDSAEIILVVEDQVMTVLVNGENVISFKDLSITEGYLAYSLLSGTNKDFGTRCQMTNVDYWEIE